MFKSYMVLKTINDINKKYCELHKNFFKNIKKQKYPRKTNILILYGKFKKQRTSLFEPYLVKANQILRTNPRQITYNIQFHVLLQQAYAFLDLYTYRLNVIL